VDSKHYKIFVENISIWVHKKRKEHAVAETLKNPFITFSVLLNAMQILQLSTALPRNGYSTEELIETFPCRLPEGVRQNVLNLGVSKRYLISQADSTGKTETVMSERGLVDVCTEACEKALRKASLHAKDIDYLVATYDANPFLSPGLSQVLVPKLGLDAFVRHVNAQGIASTAFIKGLELAENYLAAHPEDTVLVCVSGVMSYWFQNQVRGMSNVMEISRINSIREQEQRELELRKWVATIQFFLFGDGAAAAIVTKNDDGLSIIRIAEVINVEQKDYLAGYARLSFLNEPFRFGFHSHLDKDIPKLGVKYTGLVLEKLLGENAEKKMKAAKKWAVHTGSEKILDALAEHHGISREKLRESHEVLNECGNLAGASLAFILERIVSGTRLSKGDIILMLGYGWGFSASACLLESQ
jgi:predicted naringenin-chalcone synthase